LFGKQEFQDINVQVHELDRRADGVAIQQLLGSMTGQRTVPSVWAGGKFLGGNSETQQAYRSGQLQSTIGLK
jgi:glutaredoxin 3